MRSTGGSMSNFFDDTIACKGYRVDEEDAAPFIVHGAMQWKPTACLFKSLRTDLRNDTKRGTAFTRGGRPIPFARRGLLSPPPLIFISTPPLSPSTNRTLAGPPVSDAPSCPVDSPGGVRSVRLLGRSPPRPPPLAGDPPPRRRYIARNVRVPPAYSLLQGDRSAPLHYLAHPSTYRGARSSA